MLTRLFDKVWDVLDQPSVGSFGEECASIMAWTLLSLLGRALLVAIRLHAYVPNAVVFSCPPLLKKFFDLSPLGFRVTPSLPIRVAESLLGRAASVFVILPAHFIGGILGVTLVKLLLGTSSTVESITADALVPVIYEHSGTWEGWKIFLVEIAVAAAFTLGYLVIPEVLKVNRLPAWVAWVALIPVLLVKVPDQGTTLSPSAIYALWYGSREAVLARFKVDTIQFPNVFGGIIGGFLAGAIMVSWFPDEPSWNPM